MDVIENQKHMNALIQWCRMVIGVRISDRLVVVVLERAGATVKSTISLDTNTTSVPRLKNLTEVLAIRWSLLCPRVRFLFVDLILLKSTTTFYEQIHMSALRS